SARNASWSRMTPVTGVRRHAPSYRLGCLPLVGVFAAQFAEPSILRRPSPQLLQRVARIGGFVERLHVLVREIDAALADSVGREGARPGGGAFGRRNPLR